MRRKYFFAVLPLCAVLVNCGGNAVAGKLATTSAGSGTTTTLAAQTINNTSASSSFLNQKNGNLGANNVSKLDIHSLLYSGATTKVLAHLMLWFGQANHLNVGYSSTDPAQVKRQIDDMVSRGIDGVIVDWYGPDNSEDQATQLVRQEAEKHPGFSFAIMVDAGAIEKNACSGCSPQESLIQLLQYVEKQYFPSAAYMNIGGQPLITEFNIDRDYSIDWQAVNAALATAPRFLFQDDPGFSHAMSDGSYSWVMPEMSDRGLDYLSNFYNTSLGFESLKTVGSAYKGFNDSMASWGSGRVMDQQCGQTWLQTFTQVNQVYSAGRQLPYLQLVTWNDYEEGTEIESGIDPCLGLSASVTGSTLQWQISGDESTVDHFSVYGSTDGVNFTSLAEIGSGTHSADLCSLDIANEKQQLFVQAVGKPMLANRMTGPVSYSPACN
jgi:hypothetical protein